MTNRKEKLLLRYCGTSDPDEFHIVRAAQFIHEMDSPDRQLISKHQNRVREPHRHYLPSRAKKGAGLMWLKLFADYPGDKCLIFPFRTAYSPRGTVTYNFKPMEAHRAMCMHVHKLPPEDKTMALHSCGNGHLGCVNPNHLYWGNHSDNVKDGHRHAKEGRHQAA